MFDSTSSIVMPFISSPPFASSPYQDGNTDVNAVEEAIGLIVLPRDPEGLVQDKYYLNSILLMQLRISRDGVLATTYLEAEEYGWGDSEQEAVTDLISSLVEYMQSLESRRDRLGDEGLTHLQRLSGLFKRKDS